MILHAAHRALEGLDAVEGQLRFNRLVADELAQLIYDGLWFSALSRDLRDVRAVVAAGRLGRGPDPAGPRQGGRRRAPLAAELYDKDLATYDEGDAFDHAAAVGFIEIFGLPLRVEAARHGAVGKHHGAAWTWTEPLLADLPATVTEGAGAGGRLIAAHPSRGAARLAPGAGCRRVRP